MRQIADMDLHQATDRRLLRIGCAGWSLRNEQQGLFADGDSHLQRYASVFSAVEVNSCFYRAHRKSTWQRWAESTPESFRFSYKLPKSITHQARLKDVDETLLKFLDEVASLGSRLGTLLVQLPPSLVYDADVVGEFFSLLRRLDDQRNVQRSVACEARHASWFTAQANSLLEEFEVAAVAAHPPRSGQSFGPAGFTGQAYYRLHGAPRAYYSEYSQDELKELATRLVRHIDAGIETWCIFDNTADGYALSNALQLMQLLSDAV